MDAHLFRRLCDALIPSLPGARVEKIHQPGPGVVSISLYGAPDGLPKKRHLVLRADRQTPFLFVAQHRLPAPAQPPAPIMRLRKYVGDRHILEATARWMERRLYLRFAPSPPLFPDDTWLCLDLREGASLCAAPGPEHGGPLWPNPPYDALMSSSDLWRDWPAITPALRRSLPHLPVDDIGPLLMDLEWGGGDVFLYEDAAGRREVSAWPLPPAQLAAMGGPWRASVWESPFEPLALAGESQVYAPAAAKARTEAAKPHAAEASRLARLQAKLDKEEERLRALCAKQDDALLLQSRLYLFGPDDKAASVTLPETDDPDGLDVPVRSITLDPRLTVRENMAALFHQAGRGRRGLARLAERRAAVEAEKNAAEHAAAVSAPPAPGAPTAKTAPTRASKPLPPNVQAFRSGDGFLLLRGRDTKGNLAVLRLAAPHDYWIHTAIGPSAHVIIRRDHPGREVPERTLREAGALAALKSRLKDEARAEIQYALAKYIHPMRNAGPGMVRIDRSEGTFWAPLDPELETRLRLEK